MRTKRQLLYDKIYYDFEQWITRFARNNRARKAVKGLHFDREFYAAYKKTVLPYWKKYGIKPQINWFKYYYHLTGTLDPRYIPDDIHHHYLIPYFDDLAYVRPLEDKNLYHILFPSATRPETVFKRASGSFCNDDHTPIPLSEVYERLAVPGRYIIKPARDTGEGSGISFLDGGADRSAIDEMLRKYQDIDYIVQKVVVQHPDLGVFNPTSLNTIRVVTMVFNGEAHILSAILRIGQAGSLVDNISKGGYQAVIRLADGTLEKLAYTHEGDTHRHVEQTASGIRFEGAAIPCWDEIRTTVKDLALKLPHLKLIGWDFGVDEQGRVVLIEFNCHFGQNQENCGPTFGDMTEDVLEAVFRNRMLKRK